MYKNYSLVPRLSPRVNEKSKEKKSVLQAMESWVGPGNEATKLHQVYILVYVYTVLMT